MSASQNRTGVLVVNFGEPDESTLEHVQAYLERVFLQNVDLESHGGEAAAARVKQLAANRAPGLVQEYERIGGSPLNAQADAQAEALGQELADRGLSVNTYSAFQFTAPSIADRVAQALADGVTRLITLPLYPICGQSTTVASLSRTKEAMDALGWTADFEGISGWHHHPDYIALRVENVRRFMEGRDLDLTDPDTLLYFSVHGTPVKFLDEGNRYDRYVEEHTREVARHLGTGDRYAVGFQNHTNRKIEWTQPDNEDCIQALTEQRLVVVPISFMHEQSETLAELDHELREFVEGLGKEFHRVPVPHDDPAFIRFLADLVARLGTDRSVADDTMGRCRCSPVDGTWCTNGARDLPPSQYIPVRV